ncbi:MAG: S49 family peptidase [Pirellulales bacterium]
MESEFVLQPRFEFEAPQITDYFGLWCIEEGAFRSLVDRFNGINLHAHFASALPSDAARRQKQLELNVTPEGIAMLQVNGPMMKSVSSLGEGSSTVQLRQQLRAARKSPEVLGAMLMMDTPGGTARGNRDLADEVARFAQAKPIYSYTEDQTTSAGVSVASQATKRFANNDTALYGAMGTYSVLMDQSGMAEKLGVKVHVIKAGQYKGMGEPGTAISEEQLVEAQRIVNALNEGYLETIARGLSKPVEMIRSIADGRVIMARDAVGMGLLDGVQTFDDTYAQLVQYAQLVAGKGTAAPQKRGSTMDKTPASLAELKAAFPNSSAEWRESQLEAESDMPTAAVAYAKNVETQLATEREAHSKAIVQASAKNNLSLGHAPLTERTAPGESNEYFESGEPIEDFNAAVAALAGRGPTLQRRQSAVRAVAQKNPELYQAYLLATNPGRLQARLITEKLEAAAK